MNEKRQRTVARRCVTSTINSARAILENNEFSTQDEAKFNGLSGLLRTKGETLGELDAKILATCEEEDVDTEATETTEYQTEIFTCLAEIKNAISRCHISTERS